MPTYVPSPHPQTKTETIKIVRRVLIHNFPAAGTPSPTAGQIWPRN